ncbi:hypothetical protein [Bradyrhizobium sp. 1]|uniref:hypothetical protein n=1 Tax=Bradyrhizobium sp. 1 TaxID=241591 RepID=UPI001FFBF1DD|nr:hypothetical protein [Bradyrhizobium sp. 1]MCK1396434.1 hypothetical protein [Bradyrhizobium sp. 1]
MLRFGFIAIVLLFATAANAASCNRGYIEAAIDQRVPGWAIKFRTPERVNNICTLCGSFEGAEFRACVMEEAEAMAKRARDASQRFFGSN